MKPSEKAMKNMMNEKGESEITYPLIFQASSLEIIVHPG
jgi:hypothetical protein